MVKFDTGRLVMTRTVNDEIADSEKFAKDITAAIKKYLFCDWGEMCRDDKKMNDNAIKTGEDRIFAAYPTSAGKIYITTEHDRSYTTIMFADEY